LTKRTLYGSFQSIIEAAVPPKIDLVFYRTLSGNEPVRDWLVDLPDANRREMGLDLQRVQYRWPVGMPLVRPMGKGLFEVRTPLPDGTAARVLFCFHGGELYALHGFIKKAKATLLPDLEIARKRQKEVQNG
jgi:phage-related protein